MWQARWRWKVGHNAFDAHDVFDSKEVYLWEKEL